MLEVLESENNLSSNLSISARLYFFSKMVSTALITKLECCSFEGIQTGNFGQKIDQAFKDPHQGITSR